MHCLCKTVSPPSLSTLLWFGVLNSHMQTQTNTTLHFTVLSTSLLFGLYVYALCFLESNYMNM